MCGLSFFSILSDESHLSPPNDQRHLFKWEEIWRKFRKIFGDISYIFLLFCSKWQKPDRLIVFVNFIHLFVDSIKIHFLNSVHASTSDWQIINAEEKSYQPACLAVHINFFDQKEERESDPGWALSSFPFFLIGGTGGPSRKRIETKLFSRIYKRRWQEGDRRADETGFISPPLLSFVLAIGTFLGFDKGFPKK